MEGWGVSAPYLDGGPGLTSTTHACTFTPPSYACWFCGRHRGVAVHLTLSNNTKPKEQP